METSELTKQAAADAGYVSQNPQQVMSDQAVAAALNGLVEAAELRSHRLGSVMQAAKVSACGSWLLALARTAAWHLP